MRKIFLKRAFTLAEVLVAIIISGVVITSLFTFLAFFQKTVYNNVVANDPALQTENFLHLLRQELPKAKYISVEKKNNTILLSYQINQIGSKIERDITGRQCLWSFDKNRKSITREETNFTVSLKDFIADDRANTSAPQQSTKRPKGQKIITPYLYPNFSEFELQLLKDYKKKPLLLKIKTHLTANKPKSTHTELIKLAL